MGFILKYVQKTKSGYRYRRRWPQAERETLDCGEYFFEVLGKTENDVLSKYAKAERNFKCKIAESRPKSDVKVEIGGDQKTALQLHKEIAGRIRKAGFDPYNTTVEIDLDDSSLGFDPDTNSFLGELPPDLREAESRGFLADEVLNKYIPWQLDGSEEAKYLAMDIPQRELDFIRGLANGMPKMPSPTIEDARREYIEHKGYHPPEEKKNLDRINDVVSAAKEALDGDFKLGEISTKNARKILNYIKKSRGIKFSTLKRYYNDLRAMINFTPRELDCDDIVNRFEGITIPKDSIAKEEREPFTEDKIIVIATQIKSRSNGNTLSLIWSLLNGTGCRLDEIASLRTGDVYLATPSLICA